MEPGAREGGCGEGSIGEGSGGRDGGVKERKSGIVFDQEDLARGISMSQMEMTAQTQIDQCETVVTLRFASCFSPIRKRHLALRIKQVKFAQ